MKKLSIILALVMALSCFGITAFAAEESSAAAAEPAKVTITVDFVLVDKNAEDPADVVLNYELAAGGTLTAADVIAAVKARLNDDGSKLVDPDEFVINETVVTEDANGKVEFKSVKVKAGEAYAFTVVAHEINDVENLAQVVASEAAGLDWGGIAGANVALINQLINGFKAAIDSLVNAEWPCMTEKAEETTETTTVEVIETPDTGASAVAGAAVVVLALSAATAVVLRKKED